MHIDRRTVPGSGVLHQIVTRDGERFCLLVDARRNRHPFTYGGGDLDAPARAIVLEPDEADQVAEILHRATRQQGTGRLPNRLLSLERRADELIGERGP
jgi:TrkA domain protein